MANSTFTTDRSALNPDSRARALEQMENGPELDVLVVGGGVTGAGIALDAATRGLRVGIVEAQDWAGATSRWSSKLVHGGLRYLEHYEFRLVREELTPESHRFLVKQGHDSVVVELDLGGMDDALAARDTAALLSL